VGDLKELKESIAQVGLINPITVTPDCLLIAGLHRLEACRSLGWTEIPIRVLEMGEVEERLVELDENLARRELTVLERGEFLVQRKAYYEALHPETRRGTAGGLAKALKAAGGTVGGVPSFADAVARSTRYSRRTVQSEVAIIHAMPSDVREKLRGTVIEDRKSDLMRLACFTHQEQRAVADLLSSGRAWTFQKALLEVTGVQPFQKRTLATPQGTPKLVLCNPPMDYLVWIIVRPIRVTVTDPKGAVSFTLNLNPYDDGFNHTFHYQTREIHQEWGIPPESLLLERQEDGDTYLCVPHNWTVTVESLIAKPEIIEEDRGDKTINAEFTGSCDLIEELLQSLGVE
jgi:ParB family chromosome partitioning protein